LEFRVLGGIHPTEKGAEIVDRGALRVQFGKILFDKFTGPATTTAAGRSLCCSA